MGLKNCMKIKHLGNLMKQISQRAPLLVQQVWVQSAETPLFIHCCGSQAPASTNSFVEILAPKDAGISSWGLREP